MNLAGILGRFIPDWGRIVGQMQFDTYHVFTVDEHTIEAVRVLNDLERGHLADVTPVASALIGQVQSRRALYVAMMLHDIAKGRGGDHSQLGAQDARRYLKRLGYPKADIDLVAWLVEQHLLMSITAQKQDIQDPEVVRRFAAKVGDWERLECLYLLTVADIRATNPKLWNGWKARLLADLYRATRTQLRRGGEALDRRDRIAATRLRALELLTGEGVMFSTVEALWTDFPEQSFWRYSPDQLRWLTHAIIASGRPGKPLVAARSVGTGGTREIFVRMQDQDGIFATIASVLDRMDLSVTAARIMTCKSGLTLDTFQVLDRRRDEQDAMTRNQEIQMALTMALSEKPLRPKLSKRRSTREERLFRFAPQIEFEQRSGDSATQLMLVCPDRPGLLASVAHAFRDAGVRVQSARIATFGERAEDFFTVAGANGDALSTADCERLKTALVTRIEEA
jgi:[protein-PII] uridylyltransferase